MHEATGWPAGFAITIEKRIPVGAGLGGGSADAGAVLRAMNALAPHPVGEAELLRIAAPLGADVPFLTGTAPLALAWGRGERMLRAATAPGAQRRPRAARLLGEHRRGVRVARRRARRVHAERGRDRPSTASRHGRRWRRSPRTISKRSWARIMPGWPASRSRCIAAGASIARMTGSGSTDVWDLRAAAGRRGAREAACRAA